MKTGKWLVIIAALILGASSIQADSREDRELKKQQKKEMLSKLTKGTAFQAGGNEYVILPDLALEPIQRKSKPDILENEIGVLGQQKIVKKVIKDSVSPKTQPSSASNLRASTSSSDITVQPSTSDRLVKRRGTVVLNQRTGRFGLMTGNIMVQYDEGTDVSALAQKVHLKNFKDFPHLKTVFFIIPVGTDIFQATADLKSQDGITTVETEVVEHFATPR